jgi:Protein of unknown function with PCYCGC motif
VRRVKWTIALILTVGLAAAGVAWLIGADAQPVTVDEIGDENQTVEQGKLPLFAAKGDAGRLYAFAAGNADTLRWMPCTCGCRNFGHTSNRSCYVKAESGGRVTFTSHAAT